ncbi:hypothetical protein EDB89DRAFT_1904746 [Lactarius sanguifluus]|nr:hypothetical protein EDB89DRAFT_1904746 [Lactarius sanguifluus]
MAILENLITVSREYLSDGPPSLPGTVRSLRLVESCLMAVIQNSCASQSPLLDREGLPPNQRTWTETAERMGAKRQKRSHPANNSSPGAPAAEQIGKLNRKQPRMKNTDPYSGGLRSGKDAAPDVRMHVPASLPRPMLQRRLPPSPPNGPSALLAWYPNATYSSGAYSQVPYHATYPMYYSHFPQPYYPSTQ